MAIGCRYLESIHVISRSQFDNNNASAVRTCEGVVWASDGRLELGCVGLSTTPGSSVDGRNIQIKMV